MQWALSRRSMLTYATAEVRLRPVNSSFFVVTVNAEFRAPILLSIINPTDARQRTLPIYSNHVRSCWVTTTSRCSCRGAKGDTIVARPCHVIQRELAFEPRIRNAWRRDEFRAIASVYIVRCHYVRKLCGAYYLIIRSIASTWY